VSESLRGKLLIAGPQLLDPNFWRTVVLIVEHSPEGALGLVLNRPAENTVGEAVPQLDGLLDPEEPLFVGGPVAPSSVIVLGQFERPDQAALISFGDIGVLRSGAVEADEGVSLRRGRAFIGHSGWGPGQLDDELERGDWIIDGARERDAFTERPGDLWSEVLVRKGGSYALVARMPPDPSMN
jgi:putative transcriptional regulator